MNVVWIKLTRVCQRNTNSNLHLRGVTEFQQWLERYHEQKEREGIQLKWQDRIRKPPAEQSDTKHETISFNVFPYPVSDSRLWCTPRFALSRVSLLWLVPKLQFIVYWVPHTPSYQSNEKSIFIVRRSYLGIHTKITRITGIKIYHATDLS